jgi:xylulokinase
VAADEGAAYGAAILAAVGVRLWPTVDAACDALVRGAAETRPQPEVVALMNERYDAYRRIYPALRHIHDPRPPSPEVSARLDAAPRSGVG